MESKAMLDDVLQTVKGMVTNYAYALNEASSEFIYQEFFNEFIYGSSTSFYSEKAITAQGEVIREEADKGYVSART